MPRRTGDATVLELDSVADTAGGSWHMPLALAEALAAAEATVAQFGHGEVPEPCGWRRDRRRTWHIWRFFGCGTLIDLGQVPCRLRRRVVYSLGMPRAVLENVRAQVLLCVLIGASIGYPLIIAYVSAARNSHPITPPILWSRWYHPLPLNACVGFLTLCLGSLQLGMLQDGTPMRVGRLGALSTVAPVQGFHVMVSYGSEATACARSLASVLSASSLFVWLDTYRLENGFTAAHAAHAAARDAAFLVLLLTPQYLSCPRRCVELLAALRRPPQHTLVWLDASADWSGCAQAPESGADFAARLQEWLAAQGFRVVTTSLATLLRSLDAALMSREDYHAEWWRRQRLSPSMHTRAPLGKDVVALPSVGRGRLLGGRVSLWGRLLVPAGAVSSGLDALSADGSRCDRLFAVPFQFLLGLAGAVGIAAVFLRSVEYTWQDETVDVLSFGILLATCVLGWRLSLLACTTADARLAHSPALLPLLLASSEMELSRTRLCFITSRATAEPLRRFLETLGISSDVAPIDALAELELRTLHIFLLESRTEAEMYVAKFAGRHVERQMLVAGGEARPLVTSYSAIELDKSFARRFFEAVSGKIVRLGRSGCDGAEGVSEADAPAVPLEKHHPPADPGAAALFRGLQQAEAELLEASRGALPSPVPVQVHWHKAHEAGGMGGVVGGGEAIAVANTTAKVGRGKVVCLGLPWPAYTTLGCSTRLAGAFWVFLLVLILAEAVLDDLPLSLYILTLPCYLTTMLGCLLLGAFAFIRPPTRFGRLLALAALRQPEAYHVFVSYGGREAADRASAIAYTLNSGGVNTWLDVQRLENGCSVLHAAHAAARDAAFLVLLLTPQYLSCPRRCVELLAALRRPPQHTLVWLDASADWSGCAQAPESGADFAARLQEWLAAQGFRVVTTSLATLLRSLDAALMSREDYHAEWWRRQRVHEQLQLHSNLASYFTRDLYGRAEKRASLRGALYVPKRAISSGLHVLSADGSTCRPVFNVPTKMLLAAGYVTLAAAVAAVDVARLGWLPLIGWSFLFPLSASLAASLRDADARLYHSQALLPTLLISAELSVDQRHGVQVIFAASTCSALAPLRAFLHGLGISSSTTALDGVPEDLPQSTLHIFFVQTASDAEAYLGRFAGRQCERQMLTAAASAAPLLSAFACVPLDGEFARNFFEAFAAKLAKLAHMQRGSQVAADGDGAASLRV